MGLYQKKSPHCAKAFLRRSILRHGYKLGASPKSALQCYIATKLFRDGPCWDMAARRESITMTTTFFLRNVIHVAHEWKHVAHMHTYNIHILYECECVVHDHAIGSSALYRNGHNTALKIGRFKSLMAQAFRRRRVLQLNYVFRSRIVLLTSLIILKIGTNQ